MKWNSHASRSVAAAGIIGVLLLATACGSSGSKSSSNGLDTVKVAYFAGSFPSLPDAVAQHEGFFKEHGVKFTPIVLQGGGAQQGAALEGGSLDIAPQEVRAIILADSQGANFRMICGSIGPSIYSVVVRKDISTPNQAAGYPDSMKDLKGLKIGVSSAGSGSDFIAGLLLKEAGLSDSFFTRVPVGADPALVLAAFKAKQIDGYIAFEPTTALLLANGGKNVIDTTKGQGPKVIQNYALNGYVTTQKTLDARKDALTKYAAAVKEAIAFINDPKNTDDVLAAFVGETQSGGAISKDVLKSAVSNVVGIYKTEVPKDRYDLQVTMLKDLNLLKSDANVPDYSKIITPIC